MGESSSRHDPRLGLKSTSGLGGEIVEVQGGGHVIRSIGRKDRHSKVCTAKGPRDRRVRLAAHTAIQFYDVQDRLGYDRPSKAVDWLINKAKAAIDELVELPPWHPTSTTSCPNINFETGKVENGSGSHSNVQGSSFLPPSWNPDDHDGDDDTIMKSFIPMVIASSSAMQFHNFHADMPSSGNNNNNNSQDLRLSLQSLQDQNIGFDGTTNNIPTHSQAHVLLSGGTPLGFNGNNGWLDHHQRLESWNHSSGGEAGYLFNSPAPPPQMLLQQLLGGHNNQFVSQRGPLQSIYTPPVRAPNWVDPSTVDHGQLHHYPPSVFSVGNASQAGGFSGFRIPARIQGEDDEEHDGYSDKPSSTSSVSRH